MTELVDFLFQQVGVQGIFFVFTLILAYIFYVEKQEDKTEFKERERQSVEREFELSRQLEKSNEQIGKCIDTISKFEKNFDVINGKLDTLSAKIKE